jgi:hypothetical protein
MPASVVFLKQESYRIYYVEVSIYNAKEWLMFCSQDFCIIAYRFMLPSAQPGTKLSLPSLECLESTRWVTVAQNESGLRGPFSSTALWDA